MYNVLLIVFFIIAVILVLLIILQQGKGTNAGASFGVNASNTFFSANSSNNLMTKLTIAFSVFFFFLSLLLCNTANKKITSNKWKNIEVISEKEDTPVSFPSHIEDIPE